MSTAVETRALKFWQGVNQALVEEMERDEKTFLVGEDVARVGGPYGITRGLLDRFGPSRVRDTPISEPLIAGLGTGAAAVGMRPIVELMFFDFAMLAMDQIVNQAAKYRYFTGHSLPLTIRTMCGAGGPNGAQHSQNFEAWFCAVPGLKVVMPSNAADAKGLLKSAIRDPDPTLFIETQGLLDRAPRGAAGRRIPRPDRRRRRAARGHRRHPGRDRPPGRPRPRGGRAGRRRGDLGRGRRPAHPLAARPAGDRRLDPQDRPPRRRPGRDLAAAASPPRSWRWRPRTAWRS